MNIIDAWKKAKVGEKIICKSSKVNRFIKNMDSINGEEFYKFIGMVTFESMLSDDWEVERTPLVWEGEVEWHKDSVNNNVYPIRKENFNNIKLWDNLVGKRTKIRIEEILED